MFGDKVFGKHVGYPTPEITSDATTCLLLQVPSTPAWWAIYTGLLYTLTQEDAWQQYEGGMSREDAAAAATVIWDDAMARAETESCDTSVPAPYWDDESDVDAEEDTVTQIWYGIFDGEFHETVENFVIAGFLAYAGCIGCAIKFLTIAPAFRLAWKSGNIGGVIKMFIDGADAGDVDTYSADDGIIERDYVGDPEMEMHEILMYVESLPA